MVFDQAKQHALEGKQPYRESWEQGFLTIETKYKCTYKCKLVDGAKLLSHLTGDDINAVDWVVNE